MAQRRKVVVYSDVDIFLTKQTDGDITRDVNKDAIKNSLTNIVSTLQGSRRMLPEFATGFHKLLFEPIDEETARSIGEMLISAIKYWDDRLIINSLDIEPRYDENTYRCRLNFTTKSKNTMDSIDFVLSA